MTRAPVNRHRVEYGENAVWTAPAGAARLVDLGVNLSRSPTDACNK